MLWTITVILLVLWVLGLVSGAQMGAWVHILLVLAVIGLFVPAVFAWSQGELELSAGIEPPADRKLPQPAESFHQSWSAESKPPAPQAEVPFYPPPVILAPANRMAPRATRKAAALQKVSLRRIRRRSTR